MGLHNLWTQFPAQDIQSCSGRKRRIREPILEDAEHAEDIGRIKRSPENRNPHSDMESMLERSNGSINDREMIIDDSTVKHWTDVFTIPLHYCICL